MKKREYWGLAVFTSLFVIALIFLCGELQASQIIDLILTFVLGLVTTVYVMRTAEIASASKNQAEATKQAAEAGQKSIEEMKEQRLSSSRPSVIQKFAYKQDIATGLFSNYYSHVEIYNAGSGPAIELEIILLNSQNRLMESWRPIR